MRISLFCFCSLIGLTIALPAFSEENKAAPKTDGRPVYLAAGKVVVFPEGVEEAPKDYRGAIGARPLALIRIKDEIVGEVYAAALPGSAAEEAKGMAESAKNKVIELLSKTTARQGDENIEIVSLKFSVDSRLGSPWILRSLYFPRGKSCSTFKLAASEEKLKEALPYFEAMFLEGEEEDEEEQ